MATRSHLHQQVGASQLAARRLPLGRLSALLLLALVTILGTISLADAQMMQDGGDETIAGRIVVRVHGLAAGHQDGTYHVEFGFMTETILASAESQSAAIAANERLLPSSRFMSEAAWLKRAETENRSWVPSSLIRIPILASDETEQATLAGRVIARWNPAQDESFRVEFGFLPEWSLDAAGDAADSVFRKVQRAAVQYQSLLPQSRYLSSDRIATELRRQDAQWLRSSAVEVPLKRPSALSVRVSCTPLSVHVGSSVDCEAEAGGGAAPHTYSWDAPGASPASGTGPSLRLTFQGPGSYPVEVTATDNRGQTADSRTSVEVEAAPIITIALCVPSSIHEGDSTTCEASAGGGAPPYTSYSWNAPGASPSSGSGRSLQLTFNDPGSYPVEVTVADSRGLSAVGSTSIEVAAIPLTVTISCEPSSISEGDSTTCEASAGGGAPPYASYSWNAPDASPSLGSGQSLQLTFDDPGSYPVVATVVDSRGLSAVGLASVEVEAAPPTVTISCQPSSIQERSSTTCEASADGGAPPYTYSWNAPDASPSSGSGRSLQLTFYGPGSYPVEVTVTDSRGLSAGGSTSIEVESVPSVTVVSVSCSPPSVPEGSSATVTCSANVSGGIPPYTYSWSSPDASPSSGSGESIPLTFNGSGGEVEVMVQDARGARDHGRTEVWVERPPTTPTATVTCTPSTILVGDPTSCATRCSGPNSERLCRYYKLYLAGAAEILGPTTGQDFTLTWPEPGAYSVWVRVSEIRSGDRRWWSELAKTIVVVEGR